MIWCTAEACYIDLSLIERDSSGGMRASGKRCEIAVVLFSLFQGIQQIPIFAGEGNRSSSLSFETTYSGVLTVRQGQELNGQPQLEMDFPNELPDSGCPSWASPGSPFEKVTIGRF